MPVQPLGEHFSPDLGRPTKELYSMAGLPLILEFMDWTPAEAAHAYMFYTDVQYALNLEPSQQSCCVRTVERYQAFLRDDDLASQIMQGTVSPWAFGAGRGLTLWQAKLAASSG